MLSEIHGGRESKSMAIDRCRIGRTNSSQNRAIPLIHSRWETIKIIILQKFTHYPSRGEWIGETTEKETIR